MQVGSLGRKMPWRWAGPPTPAFLSEEPHGREAWKATVHWVTRSWTWLKRLSTHYFSWTWRPCVSIYQANLVVLNFLSFCLLRIFLIFPSSLKDALMWFWILIEFSFQYLKCITHWLPVCQDNFEKLIDNLTVKYVVFNKWLFSCYFQEFSFHVWLSVIWLWYVSLSIFWGLSYLDFIEILRFVYPRIFSNLGNLWHRINFYKSLLNNKNTFSFIKIFYVKIIFTSINAFNISIGTKSIMKHELFTYSCSPDKKYLNICVYWPLNMYILTLVYTGLWTTQIHLDRLKKTTTTTTFYNIGWSMVSWICPFCISWTSGGPIIKLQVDFPTSGGWVPLTHPHNTQPMLFKSKFYV